MFIKCCLALCVQDSQRREGLYGAKLWYVQGRARVQHTLVRVQAWIQDWQGYSWTWPLCRESRGNRAGKAKGVEKVSVCLSWDAIRYAGWRRGKEEN